MSASTVTIISTLETPYRWWCLICAVHRDATSSAYFTRKILRLCCAGQKL